MVIIILQFSTFLTNPFSFFSFQLILELCLRQPDVDVIAPHLERIRVPAPLSSGSAVVKWRWSSNLHQIFFFFLFSAKGSISLMIETKVSYNQV